MRKLKELGPIILIALVAISMPYLKGLTYLQADRSCQTRVGPDPVAALAIVDLDGGIYGAEKLGEVVYLGSLTNNFNFPIELEVSVEVEFWQVEFTGVPQKGPQWENINIFVGGQELEFEDQIFGVSERLTAAPLELDSLDTIDISIDPDSKLELLGTQVVTHFLGVARFSIDGYDMNGNLIFQIEPVDNLREQYFSIKERYAITFIETNGVEATVQIYANAGLTEPVGAQFVLTGGQAVRHLPDGEYWFTAAAEGYLNYTGTFIVDEADKTVAFEMTEGEYYTVTFLENNSLNATVRVYSDSGLSDPIGDPIELVSGVGTAELPSGIYWFTANLFGYETYYDSFEVEALAIVVDFTMTESALYTVTFVEENGVNATVQVYLDAGRSEPFGEPMELTGGTGEIELPDGQYWFTAVAEYYLEYSDSFQVSGDDRTVEFEMLEPPLLLYPVEELDNTENYIGQVEFLQFDPESAEALDDWYVAVAGLKHEQTTILEVLLDQPSEWYTLSGTQTLSILVRRHGTAEQHDTEIINIDIYKDGEFQFSLPDFPLVITSDTGVIITRTFDAGELSYNPGESVSVRIECSVSQGGEGQRRTVQIGAIQWELGIE